MPEAIVTLSGMGGFLRALKDADAQAHDDVKSILYDVAVPLSRHATGLAIQRIETVTIPWAENRIGVTTKMVYIVPRKRGTTVPRRKRPKFGALLLERAYDPTAEALEPVLVAGAERAVERIRKTVEFAHL